MAARWEICCAKAIEAGNTSLALTESFTTVRRSHSAYERKRTRSERRPISPRIRQIPESCDESRESLSLTADVSRMLRKIAHFLKRLVFAQGGVGRTSRFVRNRHLRSLMQTTAVILRPGLQTTWLDYPALHMAKATVLIIFFAEELHWS